MRKYKDYQVALLAIVCILINYFGKYMAARLGLPLWLDAVGTILCAYYLGPFCGAVVGASANIMFGFSSSMSFAYLTVNILTGIIAGKAAAMNKFNTAFEIFSLGSVIAIVSTLISTPLNYVIYGGYTGNIWGDGVVNLLKEWRFHPVLCYTAGEFYIDFLDKIISVLVVYLIVKLISKKQAVKLAATLGAVVFAAFFANPMEAYAEENDNGIVDYNSYVQTIYGSKEGLPGSKANDIAVTKDGLLWIGNYGGLYRYDGTEFKKMDEWESVKNVNCLFVDEEGRMWIGTNDDGLSIYINQRIANVIDEKIGLPANSVRAINFSSDGYYYVGTSDALCVITLSSGIKLDKVIPDIVYAKSIATDDNGNAVAITDAGDMFLLNGAEIIDKITDGFSGEYNVTSCDFDENGTLYIGTSSNVIETYDITGGKFVKTGDMECEGIMNINDVECDESGRIFICTDQGVGYIYDGEFYPINTNSFNSSIDHMVIDYQENLWFTSSRLGLLRLCRSPFVELYTEAGLESKVVNSVTKWNDRLYFGTDIGLDVIDFKSRNRVEDYLSTLLGQARIRCLLVDSKNHLWICTSGQGVYEINEDESFNVYTENEGTLGNKNRACIELSDGTVAVAGDIGLTFIKDGKVTATVGAEDGLTNPKILNLSEMTDGRIAAGSDGAGIFIIENYKVIDNIDRARGLGSNVILRTIKMDDGLAVSTGNGLCYIDSDYNVRRILTFPYNDNYDIIECRNKLWVLNDAGIHIVKKDDFLGDNITEYELLDVTRGLRGTITNNSWNFVGGNGNLYICCDTGVNLINMNNYEFDLKSYRMSVKRISVDGVMQSVSIGETTSIPRGASKIEIFPEIINYSINNPYVMYYLEGFDEQPVILRQRELTSLVYTNLPSRSYKFHLAVMDDGRQKVIEELTYDIEKEKEIYDNKWFMAYLIIVFILMIVWMTWFVAKTTVQKTLNLQKKEIELVKNQLRLGNETVLAIARTVDAKDENTSQHSFRVSEYSVLIAKKLGYDEEQRENLRKMALLHDIGKIGIPDKVLNKPGRLTDAEYEIMKSHVIRGGEILKDFTLIDNVSDGALYHHERYDGTGYAYGLKGEQIPLNARIIGLADAFDAMTANRIYRRKLNSDYVLSEIKNGSGTQFDPKLAEILLGLIDEGEIDVNSLYEENA